MSCEKDFCTENITDKKEGLRQGKERKRKSVRKLLSTIAGGRSGE